MTSVPFRIDALRRAVVETIRSMELMQRAMERHDATTPNVVPVRPLEFISIVECLNEC
jgi:hypothetical protein